MNLTSVSGAATNQRPFSDCGRTESPLARQSDINPAIIAPPQFGHPQSEMLRNISNCITHWLNI